jgi:hypothetical protein
MEHKHTLVPEAGDARCAHLCLTSAPAKRTVGASCTCVGVRTLPRSALCPPAKVTSGMGRSVGREYGNTSGVKWPRSPEEKRELRVRAKHHVLALHLS